MRFIIPLVVMVSLICGAVLTGLILWLHLYLLRADYGAESPSFRDTVVFAILFLQTWIFLCWSVLYFGIRFMRDATERKLQLEQEKTAKREAELQMLRAQMNPHFLFNAFNTIRSGLENPECDLKKLIHALSDYLRYALKHSDDHCVSLGEEFDALLNYLRVEKARFLDDLEVDCQIEDAARKAQVPGIILQPLVENAIKHGRQTSSLPLKVCVRAFCPSPGTVRMDVSNTGTWLEPQPNQEGGIGLQNLRHRLRLLYPQRHLMEILKRENRVTVSVSIPSAASYA